MCVCLCVCVHTIGHVGLGAGVCVWVCLSVLREEVCSEFVGPGCVSVCVCVVGG